MGQMLVFTLDRGYAAVVCVDNAFICLTTQLPAAGGWRELGEDGVAAVIHCVSVQLGRAAFNIAELELVVVKPLVVVVVVVVVRKLTP